MAAWIWSLLHRFRATQSIERPEELYLEVNWFWNRFEKEPRAINRSGQISGSGHFSSTAVRNRRQNQRLLIVWDGLTGHRSRMTWEFIRQQRGRLWVEFLPGYAPELNPVEYLWSHWKQHELPNFCPQNFGQLSHYARKALRRMRKRPTLLIAFWQQAELFPL